MTTFRRDSEVELGNCVGGIAARMNERVTEIGATICRKIEEEIAELREDMNSRELLGASVEANVETLLHALRYEIPVARVQAPTAATEYAKRLAQHGVSLNALIRAYWVGQRRMSELVFAEVRAADIAAQQRVDVLQAITTTLFNYIDSITRQVVATYQGEREQWLENRNSIRALQVREVIETSAIDVDAATESIRYPLRWHHLALVLWYPELSSEGDELRRMQRFVRELAEAVKTSAGPLFAAVDRVSAWAWLPYRSLPPDPVGTVRKFVRDRTETPCFAIGTPGAGVEGFRRSHRHAQAARAVALARGADDPMVFSATDPGLSAAALLGGDMAEARDWVSEVLGDLASDSDYDERLRETLRVFLRAGSSYKAAAAEMNLHFNSVKYRVARAVARRGRPIDDDRLEVEMALLVCHWYGGAALRRDPV
ncbi:PucR family transcriptional regulator [Nocardia beijingensis]|uniref:PucR family transcriptional regulator n=1 Tax=Nocardia beijingensis TaxID=95162 RepID=UPI002B4B0B4B|nr:helix-turn-helix domain-containing protein [Nocardia beijingensis]